MNKNKNNVDTLKNRIPLDTRNQFVQKTQKFLLAEYDTDLGEFEVEEIFDFFCEKCGKIFYNQGIEDAKSFFMNRFAESSEDIVQIELPV